MNRTVWPDRPSHGCRVADETGEVEKAPRRRAGPPALGHAVVRADPLSGSQHAGRRTITRQDRARPAAGRPAWPRAAARSGIADYPPHAAYTAAHNSSLAWSPTDARTTALTDCCCAGPPGSHEGGATAPSTAAHLSATETSIGQIHVYPSLPDDDDWQFGLIPVAYILIAAGHGHLCPSTPCHGWRQLKRGRDPVVTGLVFWLYGISFELAR